MGVRNLLAAGIRILGADLSLVKTHRALRYG